MSRLPKATLTNVINFVPNGIEETALFNTVKKTVLNDYLNDTKQPYCYGHFYLGGQIKINIDEEITLEKITEARLINIKKLTEYGFCNSFEVMSMANHERKLNQIEEIIKCYLKIGQLRELENN
jgi:hypothetical protein